MRGFNPRAIKVDVIYQPAKPHWKNKILTPEGDRYTEGGTPDVLQVVITNNSGTDIKWVEAEYEHIESCCDGAHYQWLRRYFTFSNLLAHEKREQHLCLDERSWFVYSVPIRLQPTAPRCRVWGWIFCNALILLFRSRCPSFSDFFLMMRPAPP
ncbi:MAG: hypothetical protein P4M13_05415, partial [Alphaproteobacteria bacterium]|nr:hypothetical protein [Alphaproteobacteria bacterium]